MEMMAVIEALKTLTQPCRVLLYSDSSYIINAFNQHWIENWTKNGWRTASKEEVKNKELWLELIKLNKLHQIEWIKVKGHSDNEYNNRVDKIAVEAINKLKQV
jgi:ribonuclease HI